MQLWYGTCSDLDGVLLIAVQCMTCLCWPHYQTPSSHYSPQMGYRPSDLVHFLMSGYMIYHISPPSWGLPLNLGGTMLGLHAAQIAF